jgi:regulatory protein
MQKGVSRLTLMDYALYLLSRRRYTAAEMQKKLSARLIKIKRLKNYENNENSEKIPVVLTRLQELNLLNDAEYASLYIQSRLRRKPQGIRLLRCNMAQKGLSKKIISQALNDESKNILLDEIALAERAAHKKLKSLTKYPSRKQREKLARFLASRGFQTNTIIKVLDNKIENT